MVYPGWEWVIVVGGCPRITKNKYVRPQIHPRVRAKLCIQPSAHGLPWSSTRVGHNCKRYHPNPQAIPATTMDPSLGHQCLTLPTSRKLPSCRPGCLMASGTASDLALAEALGCHETLPYNVCWVHFVWIKFLSNNAWWLQYSWLFWCAFHFNIQSLSEVLWTLTVC